MDKNADVNHKSGVNLKVRFVGSHLDGHRSEGV